MRKVRAICVFVLLAFATMPTGARQKPGTIAAVPLIVTVHTEDSVGNPCRICGDGFARDSDGNTVYADGQDGVAARFDKYGNLIIDFQTTRAKIRGLVYDYSTPLDDQSSTPPGAGHNQYMATLGGGNLQMMAIGTSVDVGSCPHYDDASGLGQFRHSFFRNCGIGVVGSPLVVTRTGNSEWTVEPQAPAISRVFAMTGRGGLQVQDYGRFALPFKMTLRPK